MCDGDIPRARAGAEREESLFTGSGVMRDAAQSEICVGRVFVEGKKDAIVGGVVIIPPFPFRGFGSAGRGDVCLSPEDFAVDGSTDGSNSVSEGGDGSAVACGGADDGC